MCRRGFKPQDPSITNRHVYVRRNRVLSMNIDRMMAHIVATIHLLMMFLNLLAVPFLIVYEPFYIWMPMITLLVSPVIGGTYCMFNRLENYFRIKAGMDIIHDRFQHFLRRN